MPHPSLLMWCQVKQIVGFLPNPNGCPLGVAVTSYRGQLQLSINADADAVASFAQDQGGNGAEALLIRVEQRLRHVAAAGHLAAALKARKAGSATASLVK
jgi:hypothetical protein